MYLKGVFFAFLKKKASADGLFRKILLCLVSLWSLSHGAASQQDFMAPYYDITTLNPLFIVEGCIAGTPTCLIYLRLNDKNDHFVPHRHKYKSRSMKYKIKPEIRNPDLKFTVPTRYF